MQSSDKPARPGGLRPAPQSAGINTLSITWITPLLARTSTATILAALVVVSRIAGGVPCTNVTDCIAAVATGVPNGIWVDNTCPGTTWYSKTVRNCALLRPCGAAANAAFVGANTVNGPAPVSVPCRSAPTTAP